MSNAVRLCNCVFRWDLIQRPYNDPQANNISLAKLSPIAYDEWLPNATTGNAIRTVSFLANWYSNDTSSKPGFYLRISFWVKNNVSGPTGNYHILL